MHVYREVTRVHALILIGAFAFALPAANIAFHTGTDLVLVPVTITDRNGATVLGLTRAHFRVLDNGAIAHIVSFERDEAPISMVLVVDTSTSMRSKIGRARIALRHLAASSEPRDEAALLTFAAHPRLESLFTRDIDHLVSTLDSEKPDGPTALLDALWLALQTARTGSNARKAVIVLSDGADNESRRTESEIMRAALESEAQVYTAAIHEHTLNREEQYGAAFLKHLSQSTGGAYFEVRDAQDLAEAVQKLSIAMRNLYVLGFRPAPSRHCPPRHKIAVRLEASAPPHLRVSARSTYRQDDAK